VVRDSKSGAKESDGSEGDGKGKGEGERLLSIHGLYIPCCLI
jgi:hypothetical protein